MSFAELPAELQIEIFSYVESTIDLKSARGVCRKFRDHASILLFRSAVACARYKAMGAFQNISLHPIYRSYVHEIIFDGSAYDGRLANNEYAYQQKADEFEDLRGVVSWGRRTRFKRYQHMHLEQEEIKESMVLLQTISRALEWMPAITTITYSPGPHLIPVESKEVKEIIPRGVTSSPFGGPLDGLDPLQDGLHHLIAAIFVSEYKGIREFIVRHVDHDPIAPGTEFTFFAFDFQPDHVDAGKYFFRNLHKINLELSLVSVRGRMATPTGSKVLRCLANLASLLEEAKDLEEFSLHLSPWNASPVNMYGRFLPPGLSLVPYVGLHITWPKLRFLSLAGIYAEEEELRELIMRHKSTLLSVKIRFCSLISGKWSNIVDEVVYSTSIAPFVLDHVNETSVGDVPFWHLPDDEARRWQYEGGIKVNSKGERYFAEPSEKSVTQWRNQDQDEH